MTDSDLPRIPYAEREWFAAFHKIIALKVGSRIELNGVKYRLHHWNPEETHAWAHFITKDGERYVRRGDALMIELAAHI